MSNVESYDGLCGIPHLCSSSDSQIRCYYEAGHHGPHSWEGRHVGFSLYARLPGWASSWFDKYCGGYDEHPERKRGFINSVLRKRLT
jgi:hypothetical protein